MRVVWLLDVDGVLNAFQPGWDAPIAMGKARSAGLTFTIRWAPALVERIAALHATGLVSIRWATTWCADIEQIESLLELPRFDRAWSDERLGSQATHSKREAARDVIDNGDYLVWTDDAAIPPDGPERAALTRDGRALLIEPSEVVGLQPEHLDQIEAFVSAVVDRGAV